MEATLDFQLLCRAAQAAAEAEDWRGTLAAARMARMAAAAAAPGHALDEPPCELLLAEAQAHEALGDGASAVEALDALLLRRPTHAGGLWARAALLERAGSYQAAFLDLHALQGLGAAGGGAAGRPGLLEAMQRLAAACRTARARRAPCDCAFEAGASTAAAAGGGGGGARGRGAQQRGGGGAELDLARHMWALGLEDGGAAAPARRPGAAEVRAAYKRMAARHHPDKAPPDGRAAAEARFKEGSTRQDGPRDGLTAAGRGQKRGIMHRKAFVNAGGARTPVSSRARAGVSSTPAGLGKRPARMAAAAAADTAALARLPFPPHPPLAGCEAGSFAEGTIKQRLPAIMGTVLSDLDRLAKAPGFAGDAARAAQIAAAAEAVKQLQREMPADATLTPIAPPPGAPAFLGAVAEWTNAAVAAWQARAAAGGAGAGAASGGWLGLPWLTVECYLYARLACIMVQQPALAEARYDPFEQQKLQALLRSGAAVVELAAAAEKLHADQAAAGGGADVTKHHLQEVFQYSLWGNKTDLSMLVDASKLDVNASVKGAAAGAGAGGNLIVDEFEGVWAGLQAKAAGGRMDVILDNAGLELYTDLVLADFLVEAGLADKVHLHGKLLPWFVSDTMDKDLEEVISILEAGAPPEGMQVSQQQWGPVQRLAKRWRGHLAAGRWVYRDHAFWTTPFPFWWMEQVSPDLYSDLFASKLLIFKGDLNYRKLAYDCRWPLDAPFAAALGPFRPAPLVTLRTLKADVMAGLVPGQGAALDAVDPDWQVNGKFGVVQHAP
ncbi:MAG: hypothetical protein J3K34DRAFT_455780 [Monoraphidium minutum]|nr:MAG: hypothetical protein J3K34DRAFT_455780 [Monoraphidium minutum]